MAGTVEGKQEFYAQVHVLIGPPTAVRCTPTTTASQVIAEVVRERRLYDDDGYVLYVLEGSRFIHEFSGRERIVDFFTDPSKQRLKLEIDDAGE